MAKKKQRRRSRKPARKTAGFTRRLVNVILGLSVVAGIVLVAALDVTVRAKFSGAKWSLPSHVYSRALELYEGLALSQAQLLWEIEQLGYRRVTRLNSPGQYRVNGGQVEILSRTFRFWDGEQPSQRIQLQFDRNGVSRVENSQGKTLPLLRLEPLLIGGIYPEHQEDREPVRLEALPPYLVESLIAVEDREFYQHRGISLRGIARAMLGNIRSGQITQGGSTITQQLVKNFFLSDERTLLRKGIEAIMAILLEVHYGKAEILEAYINEIYLGQSGQRAIHGFGMASRHYFRQPISELDLHQVALLTAMAKGASYYDPRRHPQRTLQRRNLVIDQLESQQLVDGVTAKRARAQPLDISPHPGTRTNPFPAFLDLVKRELREDYNEADLRTEGLRIFTSFDPQAQKKLQDAVDRGIPALEQQKGIPKGDLQVAAVVVRVGTGQVVAVAGSRQSGFPGFNRALDAYRQVGSTIKPAVFLTALQQPGNYNLATLIDDGPVNVAAGDGSRWQPRNFDRRDHGTVPLYAALGQSYNQATARLGMAVGIPQVAKTIKGLGHQRPLPEVPALSLGAVTMSPFEVATLYHTIASDGFYSHLAGIESVYTAGDAPLKRYPYEVEARFSPATIHLLQYALQVVMREGTGRAAYNVLPASTVLAGKTGTSNDQRDSWFAGFGGNYLAVVWIGRDDNGEMPFTGSSGALRLWSQIMTNLGVTSLAYAQPEGVVYRWTDPATGLLTEERCENARYLPFISGSAPEHYAPCGRRTENGVADWLKDIFRW